MKTIIIKEQLNHKDFLENAFPKINKPIYKKRLFIINMAFGILFMLATGYLFYQSLNNHIKFGSMHYFYLVFAILFPFLAFYLVHREKKYYHKLVDQINDLKTVYTITDTYLNVKNKEVDLNYPLKELKRFTDSPKWLIFEFNNDERVVIYKPNIAKEDLNTIITFFKSH